MTKTLIKCTTLILVSTLTLNACQTLSTATPTPATTVNGGEMLQFAITGKIGITTIKDGKREAGSAFFAWGQDGERFAIDLTGALGVGATKISFDGRTATLTSDKGSLSADTPEELLTKATGWQAPISQLSYWIMGKTAPSDTDSVFDGDRLTASSHGDWSAQFEYSTTAKPSHIIVTHTDGHRVALSINHQ